MKDRLLLGAILFFVLGSNVISRIDSISQTAKSIFHGIGMSTLFLIGIIALYNFISKSRRKENVYGK